MRTALSLIYRFPVPLLGGRRSAGFHHQRLVAGAVILLAFLAIVLIANPPQTPALTLSVEGVTVAPGQPLFVDVPPMRVALGDVTLYEIAAEPVSADVGHTVPVRLQPLSITAPWEPTRFQLMTPDGGSPIRPDASYRLVLTGDWSPLALLWLKLGGWSVEYHFTSHPSPKPLLPDLPFRPRYQEPFALTWDMPISKPGYRISPPVSSWLTFDPENAQNVYITLSDYVPGETYRVEITEATGANGVSLQRPYSFSVVTPALPTALVEGEDLLRVDKPIRLRWNEPVAAFDYHLEPAVPSTAVIDPADRRRATISLEEIEQGQRYHLTITTAITEKGAPLEEPQTFTLSVPPPLQIVETTPGDGAYGIDPAQAISMVFSEPVADQAATERALAITPEVPGHFEWPSAREVRFVPEAPFPFEAEVTIELAGGAQSVRGESGSYLEDDAAFSFTVKPDKVIDVDLSRQVVTLYEGGRPVLSSLTSTGVYGDETPTGTYAVQYKIPSTRMRGRTRYGGYYDVPDVPWVLVFWGDYTIHGAYWRRGFGFPQSAGCVSLPVPVAKQVYDWAPLGTQVVIHY